VTSKERALAKRYAFWRAPDGKPYRKLDGKFSPAALLEWIGVNARIAEQRLSWPGSEFQVYEGVVASSVSLIDSEGKEVCSNDTEDLVSSAISQSVRELGGERPLTPDHFIKVLDELTAEYLRQEKQSYVCIKYLSVQGFPAKRIKVSDTVVRFLADRDRYPPPDCQVLHRESGSIAEHIYSSNYAVVAVEIKDRSIGAANDHANSVIDFLRGLWNFFATYRAKTYTFAGIRRYPVGLIHSGAVQTLHFPDGRPVANVYWYDPDLPPLQKLFPNNNVRERWLKIEKQRRWASRKLRILPYADALRDVIGRYACALDHTNLDLASLQLWSLLEKLTNTVGGSYDETISRTVWGREDKQLQKQLLHFLRLRRNQYVHTSSSSGDRQHPTYLLKDYVDLHLAILLRNDFDVSSIEEYANFLSLPTNLETLRTKAKQLGRAIAYYEDNLDEEVIDGWSI
jgi:hypothetical protein